MSLVDMTLFVTSIIISFKGFSKLKLCSVAFMQREEDSALHF